MDSLRYSVFDDVLYILNLRRGAAVSTYNEIDFRRRSNKLVYAFISPE